MNKNVAKAFTEFRGEKAYANVAIGTNMSDRCEEWAKTSPLPLLEAFKLCVARGGIDKVPALDYLERWVKEREENIVASNALRVTLDDSLREELESLGEFYQVGPETLAAKLLRGILQPLASAAVARGEIRYTLHAAEPVKYLHRVSWVCAGKTDDGGRTVEVENSCAPTTECQHFTSWVKIEKSVYRCNGCGLYFTEPFATGLAKALPYKLQIGAI
jgi:hypothetical protein